MTPKPARPKLKDLIGYDEAAQILGVTRRTIERYVLSGKLKKYTPAIQRRRGRMPVFVDRHQVEELQQAVIEVGGKSDIA